MATNINPVFPKTGVLGISVLAAANTNYDGTGTLATTFTAGADGARIDSITFRGQGTNPQTVIRMFIQDSGGTRLFHEVTFAATTATQTAALAGQVLYFNGIDLPQLVIPSLASVRFSIGTAAPAGITVILLGGNYTV